MPYGPLVITLQVRQKNRDGPILYPLVADGVLPMNMSGEQVRAGLRNDEFVPFFQPIVTLRTGEVAGVEVLARWQHESLGIVPPGAFIATAEEEGLIGELTAMVMGKAFTAGLMLPDPQWLAINISPHLLRDLSLPKQIREAELTSYREQALL